MKVINIFGAPSSGKSTNAALLYAHLSMKGFNVELVREFAKDLVWEDNKDALQDQVYILGEQNRRLTKLKDKVDFVVSDSPLLLTYMYAKINNTSKKGLFDIVGSCFNSFDNICFLLPPPSKYNPIGRIQTFEGALDIHKKIEALLKEYRVKHTLIKGDFITEALQEIGERE